MGLLIVLLSPLWVHVAVLEWFADPDPGPIVTGFVGLLLVGGAVPGHRRVRLGGE